MDAKQQYLTYAALGRPRMCVAGIPLRESMPAGRALASRPTVLTKFAQRFNLLKVQLGAWLRTRAGKPKQPRSQPQTDADGRVQHQLPHRLVNWVMTLTAGGFLVGTLGWWSGEWYEDYRASVADKQALESAVNDVAPGQPNGAGTSQVASLTGQEVLPLGMASAADMAVGDNEVIHVVDEPALLQQQPKYQPSVNTTDRVMPAPLPGRNQVVRISPAKGDALEIESPRKTNTPAAKALTDEPPPRAVVLDATKPPQQPEARPAVVQAKPTPPADMTVSKPSVQAKPEVTVQVRPQLPTVPLPSVAPPPSGPQSATPTAAAASPKKQFAEPIDVTESARNDKPAASNQSQGKLAVTVVDIAQDGSYALITNPATRLPQRYAVGEKIFTGEVVKGIDPAKGRIQLDKRSVEME